MSLSLSGLYQYPVKSCAGIALTQASLTPYGLEQDRHWMVVDHKGRFLTQRRFPRMALIRAIPGEDGLRVEAPGMSPLQIPAAESTPLGVRVWGFEGQARDAGDVAARWFGVFLGVQCRLAAFHADLQRPIDPDYGSGEVGFADGFPFLLISQASLDQLNQKLTVPVPMDRFRPNLVVSGSEPHAEDRWQRICIGEAIFRVVKPCSRCTIPTVDQATGEMGEEPSLTLEGYRTGDDGEVYFGQNLIHETPGSTIRLGDLVTVLA